MPDRAPFRSGGDRTWREVVNPRCGRTQARGEVSDSGRGFLRFSEPGPNMWISVSGRPKSRTSLMPHPDLIEHGTRIRNGIVSPGFGVRTADGFAASIVRMVERRETVTVVDTTKSTRTAALPDRIAERPWQNELYGKLSWSVRAFAVGRPGLYEGNPTRLGTLSTGERARNAVPAGGPDSLLDAACSTDNPQCRLELCDHPAVLGFPAGIVDATRTLKADTRAEMADADINATDRNAFQWEAGQLRMGRGSGP